MRRLFLSAFAGVLLGSTEAAAQWTEVPTTAAVGALLVEIDLLTVATDRHTLDRDGVLYRSTSIGSAFVSTGLKERLDLQLGVDLWREETAVSGGSEFSSHGAGDTWVRMKWNFQGDEAEGPAWAVLPYVKLATGSDEISNGRHEPGVLIVYGRPWSEKLMWQMNAGLDWLDDGGGGRDATVTLSSALTLTAGPGWSFYGELYGWTVTRQWDNWSGELGLGLIRAVGETGWVDVGCYVGLTRAAPDYAPAVRCGWQF